MKRSLCFKVNEQTLQKDPLCSFDEIVSGTNGYLKAKFTFNRAWANCAKVAVFRKLLVDYPVVLIGDSCDIPSEALDWDYFSVRVVGRKPDGFKLTTNEIKIEQIRGDVIV